MSAGQKKRMHTVPRSYLEAFAVVDPTRRSPGIWRFDRNGAFKVVGLDQAEVVKHFYSSVTVHQTLESKTFCAASRGISVRPETQ